MLNQKNIRYILIAAVVILAVVFFFLNRSDKPVFDWAENYREDNKEPYGTYLIYNLLEEHFDSKDFTKMTDNLAEELPTDAKGTANYVFVGEGVYYDSTDLKTLLAFVENGNNAFISAKSFPDDLMTEYLYNYSISCDESYWEGLVVASDTMSTLGLYHPNLTKGQGTEFKYIQNFETAPYRWHYFSEDYFCDYEYEDFLDIGDIDEEFVNFVKVPHGSGNFYLHTTPLAFTNFHMIEEYGLEYANKVFAHFSEGDIYWDAYNHVGEIRSSNNSEEDSDDLFKPVSLSEESPLQYILSEDSLRWAWYLLLVMGGLYLIFRAKRRQRIIPVKEPNANTSLEFIETIGRLYFQQNNHLKLEEQKMKLFLNFIRDRYHLPTHNIDDKFVSQLSKVSDVTEAKVKSIFSLYQSHAKKTEIFEDQLINFHQAMDYFYKNCK